MRKCKFYNCCMCSLSFLLLFSTVKRNHMALDAAASINDIFCSDYIPYHMGQQPVVHDAITAARHSFCSVTLFLKYFQRWQRKKSFLHFCNELNIITEWSEMMKYITVNTTISEFCILSGAKQKKIFGCLLSILIS